MRAQRDLLNALYHSTTETMIQFLWIPQNGKKLLLFCIWRWRSGKESDSISQERRFYFFLLQIPQVRVKTCDKKIFPCS